MDTNAHEFWGSEIWFVQRAFSSLYSTVVRVVDPATAVLKASGTPRPTASVTRVVPCCVHRAFCFSRWQVAAWLGAGRCGRRCPAVLPCGAFARTEDGWVSKPRRDDVCAYQDFCENLPAACKSQSADERVMSECDCLFTIA